MQLFSPQSYIDRRSRLKSLVGSGQILLLGNVESSSNYPHNHYPFRQDSSFLYFFGIDRPGVAALIDVDEDKVVLYGDDPTMDDIVWTGPQDAMQDLAGRVGVEVTRPMKDLPGSLRQGAVHYLPPYRPENQLKLSEWLGMKPEDVQSSVSSELVRSIVSLRSTKSDEEIAQLHDAVEVTVAIHTAAMRSAVRGTKEFEVLAAMEYASRVRNSAFSFPPIVTTNGQTLHNYYYGHTLEEGLFLCDAGGESAMHYAGDMTRTFPIAREFSTQQKEIHTIVADALHAAVEMAQTGVLFKDVHLKACLTIVDGLKSLGLMSGETAEAVSVGAHALFFPHGLGHMMGLDVHDMEDLGEDLVGYGDGVSRSPQFGLSALRLGRKLQEGFVFTIEPGIYFIPQLIEQWASEAKFRDFINYPKLQGYLGFGGIRLENDYAIKGGKAQILGPSLPLTVSEVEDFRKSLD